MDTRKVIGFQVVQLFLDVMAAVLTFKLFICWCWYCTEKAMAPHSSTLAWKILWMEEPGGLQSMGSLRVGHDSVTSLSLFTFMHWRRKWQPTPVFLPGESQGRRSLVGCRLWGRTELDTTAVTQQQQQQWLAIHIHMQGLIDLLEQGDQRGYNYLGGKVRRGKLIF